MMEEKRYSERELAGALGLARVDLRKARRSVLTEGEDWWLEGNQVILRESAATQVLSLLGLDAEDGAESARTAGGVNTRAALAKAEIGAAGAQEGAKSAAREKARPVRGLLPADTTAPLGIVELEYGRREHLLSEKWVNPHILAACLAGQLQTVHVQRKDNFRPGMKLPCEFLHDNHWKLARACPRWPGRW